MLSLNSVKGVTCARRARVFISDGGGGGGGGGRSLHPQPRSFTNSRSVPTIDSVPQVVEVACHHSNTQTNKPTKRDGRVGPLISPLHNADKASAGPPIG